MARDQTRAAQIDVRNKINANQDYAWITAICLFHNCLISHDWLAKMHKIQLILFILGNN